jgi:hypothetical protein
VKIAVAACRQRCIEDCSAGIADRTTGRQFGTSISFGDTDHRASAVSGIDMVAERSQGHASAVTTWLRRSVEGLEVGVGVGEFVTRRTTSNQRHPIQVFRHKGTIEQRILERLPEDKELKKKRQKKKSRQSWSLHFGECQDGDLVAASLGQIVAAKRRKLAARISMTEPSSLVTVWWAHPTKSTEIPSR